MNSLVQPLPESAAPRPAKAPAVRSSNFVTGNLRDVLDDPLEFMDRAHRECGDAFRFRLGTKEVHVFAHPDQVKSVFVDHREGLAKSQVRASFGGSVLTSDGKDWQRMRKHAQGFFAPRHLESFIPVVHEVMGTHLTELEKTGRFGSEEFFTKVIHDLVVRMMFKSRMQGGMPNLNCPIQKMTAYVLKMSAIPFQVPTWLPLPINRKYKDATVEFDRVTREFLASSREERSLLDFLQKDPETHPDELRTQAISFFLAGFETTVNAMFWTMEFLLAHPEALRRMREEAHAVDPNEIRTLKDLERYSFTQACLQESMRLIPPVWFRTRVAQEDLRIGDHFVPRGASVWVSPYLTQRHPDFWESPEEFRPERFLQPSASHRHAYFPFGGGKNICIGRDMAMLEMTLAFVHLLRRFDLEGDGAPAIPKKASITIRPSREREIRLKKHAS